MSPQHAKQNPEHVNRTQVKPSQPEVPQPVYGDEFQSAIQMAKPFSPTVAALQRTIGNQAVGRLLIQPKLTLGPVGDKYEQEADAVAKQVVSHLSVSSQPTTQRQEEEELQMMPVTAMQRQEEDELQLKPVTAVQRQEDEDLQMKPITAVQRQEEEDLQMKPVTAVQCQEDEELQMKSVTAVQRQTEKGYGGGEISTDIEQSIQSARGSGQSLPSNVRAPMENAFGTDFSGVKVHTDSQSDTLNQSLQARAFTTGQDIFFRQGEYNPGSSGGQELLAHELTHVVQQGGSEAQRQEEEEIVQAKHLPNQVMKRPSEKSDITTISRFMAMRTPIIQRRDLQSPRFANDSTLENILDGTGTLKKGDENDSVRKVQHGIHDSGILFLGHGVDGKFGRETERRITRFQNRNRITADPTGEVGSATIGKLDTLFPPTALPSSASQPYTFAGMRELLCQWNSALVRDLSNLRVQMVAELEWADEEFDGTNWIPSPTPGDGETDGLSIIIATNNKTNEEVAKTLYHEYQHARSPIVYRSGPWGEEETRAFEMETHWAIDRGITPDPNLTTTDPNTGEVEVDPAGIGSTVESYPGLSTANPGEVIGKVGTNRVRVRMPNGQITIRNAVSGDSVEGPRRITPPRHFVRARDCRCGP
ncbi:MAG: DUF4157 domain-containing protein [Anaerolineae bacterium]